MAVLDEELAAALKLARTNPMFFAFIPKGPSDGALLMGKKKIPVPEINNAKKEVGGTIVFKGRCSIADGKLVMDLAVEPPPTLAAQVTRVIKAQAGVTLHVEARQVQGVGDEEEGTPDETQEPGNKIPTPPPQPLSGAGDRFKKMLASLLPAVQKLTQASPQKGAELQPLIHDANQAASQGDFAKGLEILEQVSAKLKAMLTDVSKTDKPPQIVTGAASFNTIEFRKGLLGWETARKFAITQICKLRDAIISDPEAQAEPDFNELRAAAEDMEPGLEEFHDALDDALQAASKASAEPNGEKAFNDAIKLALSHIAEYRQELETAPLFKVMDNGAYGTFNVHDNMTKALDFLAGKLQQVAK